jgi:hypothetical protein
LIPKAKKWDEQRRETRRPIMGVARMAQRTFMILEEQGNESAHHCKILDASDSGYRIGLTPMPKLEIGSEVTLEYTDKTRKKFYVRWVTVHEVGLQLAEDKESSHS